MLFSLGIINISHFLKTLDKKHKKIDEVLFFLTFHRFDSYLEKFD